MNEDEKLTEPSEESLREIPEQDFSRAIRPNRYANLRGAFQHAVFVEEAECSSHAGGSGRARKVALLLVVLEGHPWIAYATEFATESSRRNLVAGSCSLYIS